MKHKLIRVFGLMAGGLLLADAAFATVTTISYYRLGENDSNPVAGNPADAVTMDDGPAGINLPRCATAPIYDSNTGVIGSSLCMDFDGGGYAATNNTAATPPSWGIECWVKVTSTTDSSWGVIAYNGSPGSSSFPGCGMGLCVNMSGQFVGVLGGLEDLGGATISLNVWTHLAPMPYRNSGIDFAN